MFILHIDLVNLEIKEIRIVMNYLGLVYTTKLSLSSYIAQGHENPAPLSEIVKLTSLPV